MDDPDSNKHICWLCLEITPASECETINKIERGTLEFLLINIDVDISDYAIACSRCLERLQDCYNFKLNVTTLVNADIKVDVTKEFQSEMGNKNSNVCRLCMLLIKDEGFDYFTDRKDEAVLKDMISSCLPEIDLKAIDESLICEPCLSSTKKYYEFMKICQEVEQRIENYRQIAGHGMVGKVVLEDLLKSKDCDMLSEPIIIKKECTDVKNVDVNIKSEDIMRIQCEEINIKDELDNGVEASESDESEAHDNSRNSLQNSQRERRGSSKGKVRKNEGKGKIYFCPKCPYFSKRTNDFKNHILTHSDNEVHRCTICGLDIDAKLLLKAHMRIHRGPTKRYGCRECPYETDHRHRLEHHLLKHKDESEVETHKCALCPYESKYEDTMLAHKKMQHRKNIETYKCKLCSFRTKYNTSLMNHQVVHKNPDETPMYKCEKCEFETKYKRTLASHMIIHQDPKVAKKFECEECAYRTKRPSDLKKHRMVHLNKLLFRCDKCQLCPYKAKDNRSLKIHMTKTHKNPSVPNNAIA